MFFLSIIKLAGGAWLHFNLTFKHLTKNTHTHCSNQVILELSFISILKKNQSSHIPSPLAWYSTHSPLPAWLWLDPVEVLPSPGGQMGMPHTPLYSVSTTRGPAVYTAPLRMPQVSNTDLIQGPINSSYFEPFTVQMSDLLQGWSLDSPNITKATRRRSLRTPALDCLSKKEAILNRGRF